MCDDDMLARMNKMAEVAKSMDSFTFDEFVQKTEDEDKDIRSMAAIRLMNLDDTRSIPILIGLMDDPSARVRSTAALGLGHYEAAEARNVLVDHLTNDEDGHVRGICAHSLGYIGGADEEIAAALDDPEKNVKIAVIATLNCHKKSFAACKMLNMLNDPYWRVRYFACCALIDFGIGDKKIVNALKELREIPEAQERVASFAEADVWMKAHDKYTDEIEKLDDEMGDEFDIGQVLDILRQKYGVHEIPYPSQDPLGDLMVKAEDLCRQEK